MDLLTRGAGFGYIGSTITSLIYASFTFIFFAIEAVILATALELCFGIPRPIGYLICAVVIIPLVIYGITLISRFQLWTQPVWIILQILPFAAIAYANPHSFMEWRKFAGEHGDAAASSICCCSAPRLPSCSRWWRRSASRSTSCASCRATAAPREPRGGSRCSARVRAGSSWARSSCSRGRSSPSLR